MRLEILYEIHTSKFQVGDLVSFSRQGGRTLVALEVLNVVEDDPGWVQVQEIYPDPEHDTQSNPDPYEVLARNLIPLELKVASYLELEGLHDKAAIGNALRVKNSGLRDLNVLKFVLWYLKKAFPMHWAWFKKQVNMPIQGDDDAPF